eukprot:TRINITY_DN36800_c0_g1_i1.p1 TRINITY_DN36800_c0_g1~~TRINITY_DN36800_c0_g1_i1.p1  ORF type:complete len:161 (+),score=22.57 TRINITY_DN36800_c0_g1_i1:409-891(+)
MSSVTILRKDKIPEDTDSAQDTNSSVPVVADGATQPSSSPPSSNGGVPTSTSNTGSTIVPLEDGTDEIILEALQQPREKQMLYKWERDLIVFMGDETKRRLAFPPMISYHRLLLHRVADIFKIDHVVQDTDAESGMVGTATKRIVVLYKAAVSAVYVIPG